MVFVFVDVMYGLSAYLDKKMGHRGGSGKEVKLTFVLYLLLYAWFAISPERMPAHELEVLSHIIHFLPLHVCHNYPYIIAPRVVHPSQ